MVSRAASTNCHPKRTSPTLHWLGIHHPSQPNSDRLAIAQQRPTTTLHRSRTESPARTPSRLSRRPGQSAQCPTARGRSEEHTSELQSRQYLVCRLLLEKKKKKQKHKSIKKKKNKKKRE